MANKLTDRSAETRESADAREKLVRLQSSIIITCFTVSDWYDPADVVEFLWRMLCKVVIYEWNIII